MGPAQQSQDLRATGLFLRQEKEKRKLQTEIKY
jgi:hypothetical protein